MDGNFAISSDIAFTPTVKAIQSRKGSRRAYQHQEESGGWETEITDDLAAFISEQISIFFATANADGQPYIQHRGGPPGFIRILDRKTLAFADFSGNRQYITQGNLQDNPKAYIFLIDYAHRRRVKIWGEARVIEDNPDLLRQLMPEGYKARPEQVIVFTVGAWSANCPQHIPQRFDAPDVAEVLAVREARIAELETEVAALKSQLAAAAPVAASTASPST
ncbi:pyridoxamine 5'-phosphate oxidase family protein [Bradyrhizobium sp. 2TAF24]|uniref:pyridoxamine 5'-phosphate oxidase family protein n=1 Tax=Bradyrhizobium sp. 2TAF24 TaxID=3233011 RepID=UPI003F90F399